MDRIVGRPHQSRHRRRIKFFALRVLDTAAHLTAGVRAPGHLQGQQPAEGSPEKEESGLSALLGQIQDKPASGSIELLGAPTKLAVSAAVAAVSGEEAGKRVLEDNGSQPLPGIEPMHSTPPLKSRSLHSSGGLFSADTNTLPGLPFAGIATGMERIPGLGMLGSPRKAEQIQEPMPEDDLMLQDDNDDLEASLYQCASRIFLFCTCGSLTLKSVPCALYLRAAVTVCFCAFVSLDSDCWLHTSLKI
jgi:hypothetical protein